MRCSPCAALRALLAVPPETIDRGSVVSGLNRKECEHVQTMMLAYIYCRPRSFQCNPPPMRHRLTAAMIYINAHDHTASVNTPLHITPHRVPWS